MASSFRIRNGMRWNIISGAQAGGGSSNEIFINDISTGDSNLYYLTFVDGSGNKPVYINSQNGIFYRNTNIGINTNNPIYDLDISGSMGINGPLYDICGYAGSLNKVLVSTGSGVLWSDVSATSSTISVTDDSGNGLYYPVIVGPSGTGNKISNITSSKFVYRNNKLGINIVQPNYDLDVSGDVRINRRLYDANTSPGTANQILTSTSNSIRWSSDLSLNNIDISGYLSIGGNTGTSNQVLTSTGSGVTWATPSSTSTLVDISDISANDGNTYHLTFVDASGVQRMFINSGVGGMFYKGANVGINTSNPQYRLDVSGGTRIIGQLYDASTNAGSLNQVLTSTANGIRWSSDLSLNNIDISGYLSVKGRTTLQDVSVNNSFQLYGSFVANGTSGSPNQVLTSTGSGISWTNQSSTATRVDISDISGNGVYYPVIVDSSGIRQLNITSSNFVYKGLNLGLNTTNPEGTLDASGQCILRTPLVKIGLDAGTAGQGVRAIAIGYKAGEISQGLQSIAIGSESGCNSQASEAVAIGIRAGQTSQQIYSVAIGFQSGGLAQGSHSVAIGRNAGSLAQGTSAISIGDSAGEISQGFFSIAIGCNAGRTNQRDNAIAIGTTAGNLQQGPSAIAIGNGAGISFQSNSAISIGNNAGNCNQGTHSIGIGFNAGARLQDASSIAIGTSAGVSNQSFECIAIGANAGRTNQRGNAIAIGTDCGFTSQGTRAIAIGTQAGRSNQGDNTIAIGYQAGLTDQSKNTIILNATGSALNSDTSGALYVKPIRNANNNNNLLYNSGTGEITYAPVVSNNTTYTFTGRYNVRSMPGGLSSGTFFAFGDVLGGSTYSNYFGDVSNINMSFNPTVTRPGIAMFLCPTSLTNITGNIVLSFIDTSNTITVGLYKSTLADISNSFLVNAVLLDSSSFTFRTNTHPFYKIYPVNLSNLTLNPADVVYILLRNSAGTTANQGGIGLVYTLSFS